MVNPPFKYKNDEWIKIPPQGYGGIQWIIKNIIDGLLELGHHITLLGAPGSKFDHKNIIVPPIGSEKEISSYLSTINKNVIVHDHTCRGEEFSEPILWNNNHKILHSHYLVSKPKEKSNLVAASYAHAQIMGFNNIPVIRHPVNPRNYMFSEKKKDYLLYLGRVSSWKGVHIAAKFAEMVGIKLVIAGPVWEKDYYQMLKNRYNMTIEYVGEVGGEDKQKLLANAIATLVFSGGLHTPTGVAWVEPGSQVVSESAISGTPVISSENGCLKEIVPLVGRTIRNIENLTKKEAEFIVSTLPEPSNVRDNCLNNWSYINVAHEYEILYRRILNGESW